jgi:hypothetical protein
LTIQPWPHVTISSKIAYRLKRGKRQKCQEGDTARKGAFKKGNLAALKHGKYSKQIARPIGDAGGYLPVLGKKKGGVVFIKKGDLK